MYNFQKLKFELHMYHGAEFETKLETIETEINKNLETIENKSNELMEISNIMQLQHPNLIVLFIDLNNAINNIKEVMGDKDEI
jgi:hypothetical protein